MSSEDKVQETIPVTKPFTLEFRKLDLPITDTKPDGFIISSEQDFDTVLKIAHAYSKDHIQSQPKTIETFSQIGSQIAKDFQFTDQGAGSDTLAGQLRNNTVENRDCKLPTFILGLIWQETAGSDDSTDIILLKSNIAHPYVRIRTSDGTHFGHFTKPNPKSGYLNSAFELLDDAHTQELLNFIARQRTINFSLDAKGMKAMDVLFSQDV